MFRRAGRQARRAAGAAPFVPTALPGAVLWLRADLGISIGTGVSAWADQSGAGNNYTQAVGADQPGYSTTGGPTGGPALTFSGATQFLSRASTPLGNANLTAFVVAKATAASIIFSLGVNVTHTTGWAFDRNANAGNREIIAPGVADMTDGVVTNNWEVLETDRGALSSVWNYQVNGASQTLALNTTNPGAQTAASAIGAFDTSGGVPLTGSIAEIIGYSRQLSATEIATVTTYLRGRYGL